MRNSWISIIATGLLGLLIVIRVSMPRASSQHAAPQVERATSPVLMRGALSNYSSAQSSNDSSVESEALLRPTPRNLRLLPLPSSLEDRSSDEVTWSPKASFSAVSWSVPWRPNQPSDGNLAPAMMEPEAPTPVSNDDIVWYPLTPTSADNYAAGCSQDICGRLGDLDLGGPWREPSSGPYRIRGGDLIRFTFQQTRQQIDGSYRLAFGDQIRVSSDTHPELNTADPVEVMPDGTISIPGLQSVEISNLTLAEARELLEEKLVSEANYNMPRITLLPVRVYQRLNDLLAAVSAAFQNGGQNLELTVIRDGSVSLPLIGSICVVGLTRDELAAEVNARYAQVVRGIEVTVNIAQTSPAFVYVMGQVQTPGRLEARLPMTAWQAIAQAGGHLQGAKLDNVVILRRTEDWRLVATTIDLSAANRARPNRFADIFLWDTDVILVPKSRIQRTDELINLYLTQGLYSLLPSQIQFDQNSIF